MEWIWLVVVLLALVDVFIVACEIRDHGVRTHEAGRAVSQALLEIAKAVRQRGEKDR